MESEHGNTRPHETLPRTSNKDAGVRPSERASNVLPAMFRRVEEEVLLASDLGLRHLGALNPKPETPVEVVRKTGGKKSLGFGRSRLWCGVGVSKAVWRV